MGAIASLPAFTAPTNATLLGTLRWSSAQQGAVLALAGLSLTYCLNRLAIRTVTTRRSLPPSLPGWPIIGNALDMPTTDLAQSYRKLAKELKSDIISATAFGTVVVKVNSTSIAMELLDKRSAVYSSRIKSVMAEELMGWDYFFISLPNNEFWKERRRAFVQNFRPSDMSVVLPQEQEFVKRLLLEINRAPSLWYKTVRGTIGGFIVSLAYGIPIQPQDDPYLAFAEYTIQVLSEIFTPGATYVDVIPALKYLPSWFPGAGFKRWAAERRYIADKFRSSPYDAAISCLGTDKARPSFISVGLEAIDDTKPDAEHQRQVLKDAAAMFYGAGTDTITGCVLTWIWATMKNPEVLRRVHAELDGVLKRRRMPALDDEVSLPYLSATLMEAIRWGPPTPLGAPHRSTENDVYGEYFFPKGTVVIPNLYGMFRNEAQYADPDTFNPDRFLKNGKLNFDNAPDPYEYAFGFGRRACPGAHIGRSMVWLTTASLAAVFTWSEPVGEDGIPLDQPENFESTFVYLPRPFQCDFKVRSAEAQAHLDSVAEEHITAI